ncbi:protein TIFY 6B isoform X2 [Actinidia eriantha]|uniref:protein TIFY 6B isoform X2 n=1 Tax=Actinidia eriantha TaxID=165200 RepID=UPI002583992B|nr:protein TIFY 6B isoform X2 [Actinidia eriantha]
MQWSFANKVSAVPRLLSFKSSTQDDGSKKTGFYSLASTGFMTISSVEAFESNHKHYSSIMQKKLTPPDKQVGIHYTTTTYPPQQFDAHTRCLIATQTKQKLCVTMSVSTPTQQSYFLSSAGVQNVIGSTCAVNPQPPGGVPLMSPVTAVPRNASKPSGGPAQLIILYAGCVCVYDDVSPEKAQAIMLLAGNGNSATINKTAHITQVESPVPKPCGVYDFVGKQSHTTSPFPEGFPNPITVTPQFAGGSSGLTDISVARAPCHKPEPSKAVNTLGPVSSATLIPSAVPQARKASLAQFLEKRKERAMGASPYISKQSPDSSRSFSMNTAGSCPLPAIMN